MLHTPRKHSYTRCLIPFCPRTHHYSGWLEWLLGLNRWTLFFQLLNPVVSSSTQLQAFGLGPNSDLFLEFFHFSNLKFLYSRKILTIMCHYSHCLVLQLPFCLLETQRDSWAVNPLAFPPPSCSPPLAAVFWFIAQTLCCHTFNDLGPQSLPFSCPCPFICSSSKIQPWFHFCSAYPEALRVNQHFQAVWSAFCVALASPVSYPIARVVFSNLYHFPQLWSLPLWSSTLKRLS